MAQTVVSACNAGNQGSIPGSGRSPGERNGNPLQYSCLENFHGLRSLVGYSPWGCKESNTTKRFHFLSFFSQVLMFRNLIRLLPSPTDGKSKAARGRHCTLRQRKKEKDWRRRRKEKCPQVYNSALPRTLAVLEGFCSCWLELVPLPLSWISEYSELGLCPFSMVVPGRCMKKSLQMFATATQGNREKIWSNCAYQCSRQQRH